MIINALTDNQVERIFGLKRKVGNITHILEPELWKEGMDLSTLKYKDYLYAETYIDIASVDPETLIPDISGTRPEWTKNFLSRITGGKDSDIWLITETGYNNSLTMLDIIGMGVGSEITLYKECVKNPDGTPKLDKGNKIFGYAHGKTMRLFPLSPPAKPHDYPIYYSTIEDINNKYGMYWFQGNDLFGNRPIEIPILNDESKGINRVYSGVLNGFLSTKPWNPENDWLFLEKMSLEDVINKHGILERKIQISIN